MTCILCPIYRDNTLVQNKTSGYLYLILNFNLITVHLFINESVKHICLFHKSLSSLKPQNIQSKALLKQQLPLLVIAYHVPKSLNIMFYLTYI